MVPNQARATLFEYTEVFYDRERCTQRSVTTYGRPLKHRPTPDSLCPRTVGKINSATPEMEANSSARRQTRMYQVGSVPSTHFGSISSCRYEWNRLARRGTACADVAMAASSSRRVLRLLAVARQSALRRARNVVAAWRPTDDDRGNGGRIVGRGNEVDRRLPGPR